MAPGRQNGRRRAAGRRAASAPVAAAEPALQGVAPLVKKLRGAQNADGGWGQTGEAKKSDAYATGQALYALAEAGAGPGDAAVRRGASFLVRAQRQDGGWEMASRAVMRDGKPPKNLE